jgi:hypothetical protein
MVMTNDDDDMKYILKRTNTVLINHASFSEGPIFISQSEGRLSSQKIIVFSYVLHTDPMTVSRIRPTTSFHILSTLLFKTHPIIRYYNLFVTNGPVSLMVMNTSKCCSYNISNCFPVKISEMI